MTTSSSEPFDEKDPFIEGAITSTSIQKKSNKAFLFIASIVVLVFFALSFVLNRTSNNVCPGNLVYLECPCAKLCGKEATCANTCTPGCGCPSYAPYLISPLFCSASCSEQRRRDFTDCPVAIGSIKKTESLKQEKGDEIFHLRISPTFPCGDSTQLDVLLHFTVIVKDSTCQTPIKEYYVSYNGGHLVSAGTVGCLNVDGSVFDPSIRGAWFFSVARISNIPEDSKILYHIGTRTGKGKSALLRGFISPLKPGSKNSIRPILVIGDTATNGVKTVAPAAVVGEESETYSLAIHVGDASYATNKGDCYDEPFGLTPESRCGWKCEGVRCHGADLVQSTELLALYSWAKIIDDTFGGKLSWVSTMGNHDNDLPWFLTYRPPLVGAVPGVFDKKKYIKWIPNDERFVDPGASNAQKQSFAVDILRKPNFYSFDHGLMHVISIQTEDNPTNAYEQWDGKPLNDDMKQRFAERYGKDSAQYQWLEQDLAQAAKRRHIVPWILIYTHRPMFHTALHHPWCGKGGDWYVCMFAELYEPLLQKYGVNFFLTGHSHHYSRSYPMYNQQIVPKGTVHLIVGVGTSDVVGEQWTSTPNWIASRQGTILGFARYWVKNATAIYWEHVSANNIVLDSVWFENLFL